MTHRPYDIEEVRRYKRKIFEDLLQLSRIYLTLDTRIKGVKVPSEYQGVSSLTVLFGLDLPVPLEDLRIDEKGIAVTFSFEQQPHHCFLPWDAVWYIVPFGEKEGVLFEHSLPAIVKKKLKIRTGNNFTPLDFDSYLEDRRRRHCCKTKSEEPSSNKVPQLQVIDGDLEKEAASSLKIEEQNDDDEDTKCSRPCLRLIVTGDGDED